MTFYFGRTVTSFICALALALGGVAANAKADEEVDFSVIGLGRIFNPVLVTPLVEFQAVGTASYLGPYRTTRSTLELGDQLGTAPDSFEFFNVDDPPVIKFRSNRGTLAFTYDASRPGEVTLFSVGGGKFIAYFLAEFNPAPAYSRGRFSNFNGGGFLMYAFTEPFSPGDTNVNYLWFGSGTLTIDNE